MNKIHMGKALIAVMLALSMIAAIISPVFTADSTSSQVIKNAQALYDKITDTYGSFHGYVLVLSNQKLSYQQTLYDAEFYNEVYDTIVDFGSTGIDLICSIVTGGAAGALKDVQEQAMNTRQLRIGTNGCKRSYTAKASCQIWKRGQALSLQMCPNTAGMMGMTSTG